jgi:hypothetical protein
VKYKWKSAVDARVISPKTKEQVAAEAAGRYWFIMTCKDDAFEYIHMHAEDGCTYDMWKELRDRYDVVRKDDLADLYTNFTETVNAGSGSDDPKLWFKKIEQVNKKVKKAGGQLKEDVELIALTTVSLKANDLYKVKVDAIKASLKGKPTYDELQEYYRDYCFSEVRKKEDLLNEAHFLNQYGFRYHKNSCHMRDAMGHKKGDCPERKDDGNNKPPYKKKFEGNNFKKKYEGNHKKPYKKRNIEEVQCYNCQGKGHYARDCPQKRKFENMFVGCVETAPKVTVSWDICEKQMHRSGNCV